MPALERLRLPIPLGGTSNHFRFSALRSIGAWDPYNVTEDADLGIRLARAGLRTGTIASTTWEEAPVRRRDWLGQRTRWLKGWFQTWLVHMRQPGALLRELGPWRFAGLQLVMGGVLLSALAYPVSLLAVLMTAAAWGFGLAPGLPAGSWLWHAAIANLVLGVAVPMATAAIAVSRRRRAWLVPWVLLMPVYWLLISAAGCRALAELARRPFHWEKTRHGMALGRRGAPGSPRPHRPG